MMSYGVLGSKRRETRLGFPTMPLLGGGGKRKGALFPVRMARHGGLAKRALPRARCSETPRRLVDKRSSEGHASLQLVVKIGVLYAPAPPELAHPQVGIAKLGLGPVDILPHSAENGPNQSWSTSVELGKTWPTCSRIWVILERR